VQLRGNPGLTWTSSTPYPGGKLCLDPKKISSDFLTTGDCRWLLLTENLTQRSASGISSAAL
jgi:hypothetical protein